MTVKSAKEQDSLIEEICKEGNKTATPSCSGAQRSKQTDHEVKKQDGGRSHHRGHSISPSDSDSESGERTRSRGRERRKVKKLCRRSRSPSLERHHARIPPPTFAQQSHFGYGQAQGFPPYANFGLPPMPMPMAMYPTMSPPPPGFPGGQFACYPSLPQESPLDDFAHEDELVSDDGAGASVSQLQ